MYDPSARYELSVWPKGRTQADEYYHQGQVWVEGREGSNYTLRFNNRSQSRVLVIFSVDGLDVLKGQPAGHLSEGYVVNASSYLEVPGWKVDDNTAAEFFFSKAGKSYVTKMGHNASNTGVIGAMVFEEAQPWTQTRFTYVTTPQNTITPWISQTGWNSPIAGRINNVHPGVTAGDLSYSVGGTSTSALNMVGVTRTSSGTTVNHEVGTGFGDAVRWDTVGTTFNRANPTVPNAIMAIYYDTAKGLQRRGIVLKSRYSTSTSNNPFPAYTSGSGVTPPPDWKP